MSWGEQLADRFPGLRDADEETLTEVLYVTLNVLADMPCDLAAIVGGEMADRIFGTTTCRCIGPSHINSCPEWVLPL